MTNRLYFLLFALALFPFAGLTQVNCEFTVPAKACIDQQVKVLYTGGASVNATYLWDFDGAIVVSGTGQGPYFVRWTTPGEKHVVLTLTVEGQTCTLQKPVVVVLQPAAFNLTGGGVLVPGGTGVAIGLSGSETGVVYKLRRDGQYNGVVVTGTGQALTFGSVMLPGTYTAVAKVDGSDCMREMEGVALVQSTLPPPAQGICMVTFDTAAGQNRVIWNKNPEAPVSHYNIYRETYQAGIFSKIGEVPHSSFSVFNDANANPLVMQYRYRLSVTDTAGMEGEPGLPHRTIHLNINPGIFGFNLIWNHYEGFEFSTYRIHRKHDGGAWEVIDSIASNADSYTDLYTTGGISTYFIEVVRPEPCMPSLKSGGITGVLSNIVFAAPLGVGEEKASVIFVYPNPASDAVRVNCPGHGDYRVEVLTTGGIPVVETFVKGNGAQIKVADLPRGLYFVRLTGGGSVSTGKFIKD